MPPRLILFLLVGLGFVAPAVVSAAPEPDEPARRTPWHLYLDARESHELMYGAH